METGRRNPPRIDMLTELSRILRVTLGGLLGQTVLMEESGNGAMSQPGAMRS
ncbi:hypothetical protein PV392_09775 [Streptomyces sp. ME03-5709C]|nr:hypothetical protein [Streptomyces sp. ME03-5709C]